MTNQPTEDELTQSVRAIFGSAETDDTTGTDETDEHKPPVDNFVPREGNTPQPRDDTDAQFIRDLFDLN